MDQKKRVLFSIAVILLIFAALFVSFGRSLFNIHTPAVVLPQIESSQLGTSGTPGVNRPSSDHLVSVSTQTVQRVIATLDRSVSYYREVTIEQFWEGGSSSHTVQTWIDRDWSLIRQLLPSNVIRQDLIGPEQSYYWYENSNRYETLPTSELAADLAQRIPTYETVLDLEPSSLLSATYQLKGTLPCIYVQAQDSESNHIRHFWISVDSGLLEFAEVYQNDQLIYRMSVSSPLQSPCPSSVSFQLPDGTVLHDP